MPPIQYDFSGQVALVTGAASGMGLAAARAFAEAGAAVVLADIREDVLQAAADEVVQNKLTALGGDGGVIAVAPDGQMAWSYNTSGMYRARLAAGEPLTVGIYKDEP
jgi:NAD(P)-dependent dehydrogenase (short-subunit alcohol dehydrogenase family)